MAPTIAALLVTYQQRSYVDAAVDSLLAQHDQADEIVLVDDGSTDGTPERVVERLGTRVRPILLPHRGIEALAEAYNAGVDACRTDLISILEGDDRWHPTKLAAHRLAFQDERIVLAHGPYSVIGARDSLLRPRVDPLMTLPRGPYDAFDYHLLASYVMGVTVTIRRSALDRVGGFAQLPGTPHVDYATYLRLSREGLFHNDDEVHAAWRKHRRSGTSALAGVDLDGAGLCLQLALQAHASVKPRPTLPDVHSIVRAWRAAQGRQIWSAARLLLAARDFYRARGVLGTADVRNYPLGLAVRIVAARVAAALRIDLEGLARLRAGRSVFEELE